MAEKSASWWYAGRDANQKDWCIPIRAPPPSKEIDGRKWTTKWELFTGHRPRVSQHYPFGWAKAREDEMRNLANHDAFTEVPESELPTWNGKSATEVVNTLWVLKKKRGHDGQVTKFKARCVFDGRNQKAVAARLGVDIKSYAPCGRPSTHKALIASAVFHKRRHRTFDVTGAYLNGQFNETEVVYATYLEYVGRTIRHPTGRAWRSSPWTATGF